MKLVVVGFGKCGGNIADEFVRLNEKACRKRKIDVILDAIAVDSDASTLLELDDIKYDYQHRVLIGGDWTRGAGVSGDNNLATKMASNEIYRVINALQASSGFTERNAIMLAASTAGGVGSAALPIVAKMIKQTYLDRPVYSLLVLPAGTRLDEMSPVYKNTATCLRMAYAFSDAVILVDNERFVQKDSSLKNKFAKINKMIVEPFYNFLCSGEERKAKYIGSRTIDAGEILQTLSGWTAIGCGRYPLPKVKSPILARRNFRKTNLQSSRGLKIMDRALAELSVRCNIRDAGRALYLLTAPSMTTRVQLIADLNQYFRQLVPDAELRSGDYPRESGFAETVVILSHLKNVDRIHQYFNKSATQEKEDDMRETEPVLEKDVEPGSII